LESLYRSVEGVLAGADYGAVVILVEPDRKVPGQGRSGVLVRRFGATKGHDKWADGRGVCGTDELHSVLLPNRLEGFDEALDGAQ
jgi:hypothetical protein